MIKKILGLVGIGSGGGLIKTAATLLIKAIVRTFGKMLTERMFDKLATVLVREALTRISENTSNTLDDRLVELLLAELDDRGVGSDAAPPPTEQGGDG